MRKLDTSRIVEDMDKPGCNPEEIQDTNRLWGKLRRMDKKEKRTEGPQKTVSDLARGRTRIR